MDTRPERWFVVAGSRRPTISNKYDVKQIKVHPEFVIKPSLSDIAVLVIKGEFNFHKNLKVMSMANSFELPKGTACKQFSDAFKQYDLYSYTGLIWHPY